MTVSIVFIFVASLAIAYANGANDVSKGIATLAGSGVTNLRSAMQWGTLWTAIGGVTAAFLAKAMLQTFGRGLLAPGTHPTLAAALAIIAGAALWVGIATRGGLPVSTTHAIVGSVAGVAWVAYGIHGVAWVAFGGKIVLPLLLSPLVSLGITTIVIRLSRALVPDVTVDCVCFEVAAQTVEPVGGMALTTIAMGPPQMHLVSCASSSEKTSAGITVNHLHWLTSGATSFARALNDTPKMAALALGAMALGGGSVPQVLLFVVITAGMLGGSWFAGRRVTEVLSGDVTRMDHREGFLANLVSAALVGPGAAMGLPMSTTHVASGAIIGVGISRESGVNRQVVRGMVLAWIVTLPAAALLGVFALLAARAAGLR